MDYSTQLFEEALLKLKDHFMSLADLNRAGENGELVVDNSIFHYDYQFCMNNPDHPMGDSRFERINGADQMMRIAVDDQPLPDEVLGQLHLSLFDCCATVRLSIAETLKKAGSKASIPYLKELLVQENDSKMVKEAADAALRHLCNKRLCDS